MPNPARIARIARIAELRANIVAASIAASCHWESATPRDWAMVRAHNAINHRTTLNRHPEVAAYWAAKRLGR